MEHAFIQFKLLFWKNCLLQWRKKVVTAIELGLPALFALILIFIRQRVEAHHVDSSTIWDEFQPEPLPIDLCPSSCIAQLPWKIFYSPENNITTGILENAIKLIGTDRISRAIGFTDEDSLVEEILSDIINSTDANPSTVLGGIVFPPEVFSNGFLSKNITYKIRLSSSPRNDKDGSGGNPFTKDYSWKTNIMYPLLQVVGPRANDSVFGGAPGYMREGFLSLQYALNTAIMNRVAPSNESLEHIHLYLGRFPYPPFNNDKFVLVLQQQFPLLIILSFVFSALIIVKEIVHEKERKLKESMKMMGLSGWLHWTAWFVKYFLFLLIAVILMTVFYTISFSKYGSVIGYTAPSVLLVFLMIYSISIICFCFMISAFFKKANTGAAASGILFFFTYAPYSFIEPRYQTLSLGTKLVACLLSNTAMSLGAQILGMYEGIGEGVQWDNLNQGVSVDDDFTMLDVFIMLIVDSVVYLLIAWYVDNISPGEYGIPKPWYFIFQKSFWCGTTQIKEEELPLISGQLRRPSFIEEEPTGLNIGIQIINLTKEFHSGSTKKIAVDKMNLNLYEGQITALLGHNGAGKTTTMSMLTGFLPPTAGTAYVNGYNIRKSIDEARVGLGLCPQHDVLFDTLTVEEHLIFFAKLKGYPSELVNAEVERMIHDIGLTNKRYAQSKTLSGGMKRKLSCGIALVGNPKVVILDEPTSGMDPDARRSTWDLLQKYREGRTMLLTTHFMDEADLLGDRIAIMSDGRVQCCGSSLFLKTKYGAGYHMVIVKQQSCDVDLITDLVMLHVPDAYLESNISAELAYVLPQESSWRFPKLFLELETRMEELKIDSFGASVTTMEEVFLKVGINGEGDESIKKLKIMNQPANQRANAQPLFNVELVKNTGSLLLLQQFWAMFTKRIIHTLRNSLVTLTQLLIPLLNLLIILVIEKTLPKMSDSPPLTLNLTGMGQTIAPYSFPSNQSNSLAVRLSEAYAEQFDGTSTLPVSIKGNTSFDIYNYIIDVGMSSLGEYTTGYSTAASFNSSESGDTNLLVLFNGQAYHTPAMSLGVMQNAMMRFFSDGEYNLTTVNHPLPRSVEDTVDDITQRGFEGFTISIFILFGLSFLASSFTLFLIKERATQAKHSQFVSGVNGLVFWLATFSWDLINYLIPISTLMLAFIAFNVTPYIADNHLAYILLLFLLYGWAILPSMYCLSFVFKVPASGFVWLTMINLLSGIATLLAVDILKFPQLGTADIGNALEWLFMAIMPNFCLGEALIDFYNNYQYLDVCTTDIVKEICQLHLKQMPCCKDNCGDSCIEYNENYLGWEAGGIGRMLVFLAAQGNLYFFILFLIEFGTFRKIRYLLNVNNLFMIQPVDSAQQDDDEDVANERRRVNTTPMNHLLLSDCLLMKNLTKFYDSFLAVDRTSIGIKRGQCFGLLGVNGAGKTSTFKMLTGDESISSGEAYLNGFSIKENMKMVQQQLGYCPQFDALIDQMTGREMLTMYARLRGIAEFQVNGVVHNLLRAVLLEEHAEKLTKDYSGGNKRKLSTALALVGDPEVIFLDEPTTGMDPVARRLLWDTLSRIRESGRTLVLTSHSMEECEALCTQIAIMVNGTIRCLGSTQHLKNKFGEGYTIIAKVGKSSRNSIEESVQTLMNYIEERFPGSKLKDFHQKLVHYHVSDPDLHWSEIFKSLEEAKTRLNIEDYSVSQTSLEQVFINLVRSQIPPIENDSSSFKHFCQRICCCSSPCCVHSSEDHASLLQSDDLVQEPVLV